MGLMNPFEYYKDLMPDAEEQRKAEIRELKEARKALAKRMAAGRKEFEAKLAAEVTAGNASVEVFDMRRAIG